MMPASMRSALTPEPRRPHGIVGASWLAGLNASTLMSLTDPWCAVVMISPTRSDPIGLTDVREELTEAIPPAYTEYIGKAFLEI